MSKEFVKGFSAYLNYEKINEMASELSKLGVPDDLMRFIHKLEGKYKAPRAGDRQRNPLTGKDDVEFHTKLRPIESKKGGWPATEDVPLSHDVQVIGTKGPGAGTKRNIQHYLETVIAKDADTDVRLILHVPSQDWIIYITRKTGKNSPDVRQKRFGSKEITPESLAVAADKTGMYIRGIFIDGDSGTPITSWVGTIGQMMESYIDDSCILYIMEKEDRVRTKRNTRSSIKKVTDKQFIDYFIENFNNIVKKSVDKQASDTAVELRAAHSKLDPISDYDGSSLANTEAANKVKELQIKIKQKQFDPNSLLPNLNNFLELAFKDGEYEKTNSWGNKADLTDMINKHTMPTVASMFLQFIVLGKVYKRFYTDNPISDFGLDDLLG